MFISEGTGEEADIERDAKSERLLAGWRERIGRGEKIDPAEVERADPRLVARLREGLATLERLERAFAGGTAASPPESLVGSALGPYRVISRLGSGGMGDVWLAAVEGETPSGARGDRVAVKVVRSHLLERPGFLDRFRREAEVGTRIRHENVVRTLDTEDFDAGGFRHHCLVMEYVEGQTLRALLAELDRLPEDLCRHVGREIAKGLAAIHAAGVVHRDLKPDNVIVTKDHVVKVMDLGVALLVDESARLSQTGVFVGSIHYAAPEQFRRGGRDVDARADLHALGVVLYELATGTHPYPAEDFHEVMRRLLTEKPRRAAEINPQLTPFFEEMLAQLLQKDPDHRFASAGEVAAILADGEESSWWHGRARALRLETKRPLRRIRIPRETALYGRDAEMSKLHALFEKAKAGDGQVLLLEGEAGIGKSRLVDEFVGALQQQGEDPNFLFGSYPPGGAATASGAFTTAYREHFGEESLDEVLRGYLTVTPILVPAFAALLRGDGTPDGAEPLTKDSLQTVFVHATRALAAERTTIVLIEDLHFAPEEGRALFASLALAVPGHRILLVGATRQGLDAKWIGQLARHPQTTQLALPRLGPKELVHLLRDALKSERLAEELGVLIAVRSDGNPFFVFEMLRGLKEGQFLAQRPDGTWHTTQVIRDIQVPSSILDLVRARVADLATAERDLLDIASCCGFEFDPSLVAAATGQGRIPTLKSLAQIERAHRLVRSSGRRFVFDHHQVQEALYGSLPEGLREEYHAAIGEAIEARHGAAAVDPRHVDGAVCVDLAEHFLRGARGERALGYLDAALTHLDKSYLNDAAIRLADRALAVPGLLAGKERCKLLLRRAGRHGLLGRSDDARTSLDEANALAEATADASLRAESRIALGSHLVNVARYEEARRVLGEALDLAREVGCRKSEATATHRLGGVFESLGRYDEARAHLERSLVLLREIGDRRGEAAAIGHVGLVFESLGRYDEARAHQERSLAIAREIGDRKGEAHATGNLGTVFGSLGRYDQARTHFQQHLAIAREIGHRRGETYAAGNLGTVLCALGRHDEARAHSERSLAIAREIGDRSSEAYATGQVGSVFFSLGRHDEARAHFERRLAITREIGERTMEADAIAELGATLVEQGLGADAATLLRDAAAMAEELGYPSIQLLAKARLANLASDDRASAVAAALAALTTCEAGASSASAMEARFLLWQATGDRAHLSEAKRRLDFLVAHAPPQDRESMLTKVRLHREIAEAATAAGL